MRLRALTFVIVLGGASLAQAADLGMVDGAIVEPDADAPTVAASLERAEAYVGDRLALTVTAIARAGIAVSLPHKLELGSLELLDRDDSEASGRDLGDGRRSFRFLLYLSAYEVGPTEVPSLPLTYLNPRGEARSVSTAPVPLSIHALVDESASAVEPQPPRQPRPSLIEDRRVLLVVYTLAGAIGLVLLAVLLRRLWRRARKHGPLETGPVVPARPPGEVAIERLSAIRARGDFGRDGYRPFAFETAEVVRGYLGARYGFDALELTSTELLVELVRAAPHLAVPGSEVLRFLEETDLIKFAKAGGSETAAIALLDAAQSIVLSTASKLEIAQEMLAGPVRPPMASESARGPAESGEDA